MSVGAIVFDCFGTVFDMSDIPREEIAAYVKHVRASTFSPYEFPRKWHEIAPHQGAATGIESLQSAGKKCFAFSNGTKELIADISERGGIAWDGIIDLAKHRVYKPNPMAYRIVKDETGFDPADTLLVTANPTFGDVEGAESVGMKSMVIRNGEVNTIHDLADRLGVIV